MHDRIALVNATAMAMLGIGSLVTAESSPVHVEDLRMHLKCSLCKEYPGDSPRDQHCIERCQNGECKHVRVVYPPD